MRWEGREESRNVQDLRGLGRGVGVVGGGLGIFLLLIAVCLGVDPQRLLDQGGGGGQPGETRVADPEEEELAKFTKVIFRDTEVVWEDLFTRMGKRYEKPTLVLYTNHVESACGSADSSVGPFYCPGDQKVYIDLSFYRDMKRQLDAPGEFARAYVIAHEVGHHVQNLLGYSRRVREAQRGASRTEANKLSVRLELQADFLAGVWAHKGQEKFKFLEPGDVEAGINAAYQIGDDRLQMRSRGFVVPHSFTHGTSEQRVRWFKEGLRTGDASRARELFELPYSEL